MKAANACASAAWVAGLVGHTRVFLDVFLDPGRSEVHSPVLEAAEPGQNQAQSVRPRRRHQPVDNREIKTSFHRLHGLPLNWNLHRVDVDAPGQRPGLFQFAGISAGIPGLNSQDQKGMVVNEKAKTATVFD
jgi:hypothetical protein